MVMKPLPPQLQDLAPYIDAVSPYLDRYGYLGIFLGVLLEDFGAPLPGESLLVAGALFASLGSFRIEWVMLLGFVGAVLGDSIGFLIGRYAGYPAVLRYGRFVFLKEERLRKLESFFARHGGKTVIIARFIEGLRQFNGIVAGLSRMRWRRFLIFNMAGAALWVGVWGSAAYFLGSGVGTVINGFKRFEAAILMGLGSLVFLAVAYVVTRLLIGWLRRK
jgi:membrane protein DedA with SNARE-associated domain